VVCGTGDAAVAVTLEAALDIPEFAFAQQIEVESSKL
jgi:hypothetical protein